MDDKVTVTRPRPTFTLQLTTAEAVVVSVLLGATRGVSLYALYAELSDQVRAVIGDDAYDDAAAVDDVFDEDAVLQAAGLAG